MALFDKDLVFDRDLDDGRDIFLSGLLLRLYALVAVALEVGFLGFFVIDLVFLGALVFLAFFM